MKIYLAAGWFSKEQEEARLEILTTLVKGKYDFYSPKEHGLFIPGETDPKEVFDTNVSQIRNCDLIVASTEGKDMGTLFECGMAYVFKKPVIYYWRNADRFPLNLMLSASALYIATDTDRLLGKLDSLRASVNSDGSYDFSHMYERYEGEIE